MLFKLVFGILLAVFLQFVLKIVYKLDYHRTIWNHQPGKCHVVPGIEYGSEDMQTTSTGLTFITSGVNGPFFTSTYQEYYKRTNIKGKIFVFNMEKPNEGAKELMIVGGNIPQSDFVPHGISLVEENGFSVAERLEHRAPNYKASHLQSARVRKFTCGRLNDVTAVDSSSFYTTNFGYYRNPIGHAIQAILGLAYGNKRHIYVVSSGLDGAVHIYKRENDNKLTLFNKVPLATVPDNPTIDMETGSILLGCHPIKHQGGKHLEDPSKHSAPSQVLMLHMDKTGSSVTGITELYSDDGHVLYGSSSAVLYKKHMLVGTVAHKMLYCEVNTL